MDDECCKGLLWLRPVEAETPRGMLERPAGCRWPKICATDRKCWEAAQIEREARQMHERIYRQAVWAGRTTIPTYEEWSGLVAMVEEEEAA